MLHINRGIIMKTKINTRRNASLSDEEGRARRLNSPLLVGWEPLMTESSLTTPYGEKTPITSAFDAPLGSIPIKSLCSAHSNPHNSKEHNQLGPKLDWEIHTHTPASMPARQHKIIVEKKWKQLNLRSKATVWRNEKTESREAHSSIISNMTTLVRVNKV